MNKNFGDFLVDKHADQYQGLDDEMGEDFNEWLTDLDTDELIEYADEYAKKVKENEWQEQKETCEKCKFR